ncbi:hypothetical protein [Pseudomonas mandelii]|jgi:hypothetical protein|uniref:Uncharacterized protein n=1 Tax=Pseudomonas mandelii TaxID=75612 RepID=A0ABY0VM56_9PSED|nr:hypothetical protein [Pseudomonas mandelii]TWS05863.1 hypothetical protein FJD35_28060 [Pseudomonas mandelii]SDU41589.1 hypothetical protein SAMN04489801_2882 [Pseudomonas mandelii]
MIISRERLASLLIDTKEALDLEVKNWLDLQGFNHDKACHSPQRLKARGQVSRAVTPFLA